MAKNFGFGGPDPMALMMAPDIAGGELISRTTAPMSPPGGGLFDFGSDGWQNILMGLSLIDASKRRVNPPPLSQTIAPFVGAMAQQGQQRRAMDFLREVMRDAPPTPGAEDATIARLSAAPAATTAGNAGNAGLVPGGALASAIAPGQYAPLIQSAAAEHGIPADIFTRQIAQESGFNPNAVSPAGARGIAQFMPATAQRFGIDPLVPDQAIPAAAKYVAANRDMFGGNLGLALAGYNWGEGNVQKWLANGANPAAVPAETRKYVQNITGQPIDVWASQSGGAPDTVIPSPDARQLLRTVAGIGGEMPQAGQSGNAGAPQYAQVQPGPRELAQARAYMPTTQPPPRPDMVTGQRTQSAAAARSFQYWSRAMVAAGLLGEPGKGIIEAAKANIEIAKGFMTPTEMQKNVSAAFPGNPAAQAQALRNALTDNSPAHAGAVTAAQKEAELRTYGAFKGIDVQADNARQTGEQKDYGAYVADETMRGRVPQSFADWDQARRRAGATMINTAEGFSSAQTKARLSLDAETAKPIIDIANSARRLMPAIDQAISLANSTPGGWAGPISANLARAFSAAGWPVSEGMSNAELLTSINQRLIPLVREPGQQSNAEMDAYLRAGPGIMLSKEGRLKIGEMMKAMGNRAIEVARIYRQNLGRDDLFEKLDELDNKPVFTVDQKRVLQNAETLLSAKDAITKGAPRDAVIKRLMDAGIDASGL